MATHNDETLLERYQREHRVFEGIAMAQHTPKVPMHDDEIRMHKPVCAEFVSFRAGIRCAERVYQVNDLVRQVNHWTDEWSDVCDQNQSLRNQIEKSKAERASLRAVNAELLEALKGVAPYMEAAESAGLVGDEGCHWPVELVRAAIAKAQGEQP